MGHYIRQELSQFGGLVSNSFLRELKTNCLDCVGLRDEITEKCCIYFKSTLFASSGSTLYFEIATEKR